MHKFSIQAYLAVIAVGLILFMACAEDEPLEPLQVGSNVDKEGGTLKIIEFLSLFKSDD